MQNLSGGNVRHLSVTPGPERNTQGCGWPVPFNMAHSFPLKNSLLPFPLDLLKCRLYYPTLSLCVCIDLLRHWSVAYQALTSSTYFRHDDITFSPLGLATRHDVTSYEFESTYEMTRTTPFLGVDSHDRSRCQIARHGGIHQPHRRSTFIIIPTKPTPFFRREKNQLVRVCVCVFA